MPVVLSLNRHLARISEWCKRCGMLINPVETKDLEISRSRTLVPIFPNLLLDGILVENVIELKVLGAFLDTILSFEIHSVLIGASTSSNLEIIREALCLFGDPVLVLMCFWSYVLLVPEYCLPVWMTAAASLLLPDRVMSMAV